MVFATTVFWVLPLSLRSDPEPYVVITSFEGHAHILTCTEEGQVDTGLTSTNLVLSPGQWVTFTSAVQNQGSAAGYWYEWRYFSSSSSVSDALGPAAYFDVPYALAAGDRYNRTHYFAARSIPAGQFYMILETYSRVSGEPARYNDTAVLPLTIQAVDLEALGITAPAIAAPDETISLVVHIRNNGPATIFSPGGFRIYISEDAAWSTNALPSTIFYSKCLTNGETVAIPAGVQIPYYEVGQRFLIAHLSPDSAWDANPSNDIVSVPIEVTLPDLVAKRFVSFPFERVCPGPYPESEDPVYRRGWTNDCPGAHALQLVFDTQTYVGDSILRIRDGSGMPVPGSAFWWDMGPSQYVPGDRAIIQMIDVIGLPGRIEVVEIAALGPETTNAVAEPHQPIQLSWTVANEGPATALRSWIDEVWLSDDPVWDVSDVRLGGFYQEGSLAAGGSYVGQGSVRIPGIAGGNYWLLLKLGEGYGGPQETTKTNNILAMPLAVRAPADLVPIANIPPVITTNRPNPQVQLTWTVTNIGVSAARGEWYDRFYVSTNAALDKWARSVGSHLRTEPVYAGTSYTKTQSFTLPLSASGQYYLILSTDGEYEYEWAPTNRLYEIDESNNIVMVPFEFELKMSDLVIANLTVPEIVTPSGEGARVQFGWRIANQGVGPADPPWPNTSVAVPGGRVSTEYFSIPIAPQQEATGYSFFELPNATNGAYQLLFRVDNPFVCNCVFESDESNNEMRAPFRVVRAPVGIVAAGSQYVIPVRLGGSMNLSSLQFTVRLPSDRFAEIAIQPLSWTVQHASVNQTGSNTHTVSLTAYSGLSFAATPDVARLILQTRFDQPSAFIPVRFEDIAANDSAGQPVEDLAIDSARVVIIGHEPLLEINALPDGQHSLTIYAWPERTVFVETSSILSNWSPLVDFNLTDFSRTLGPFVNREGALFYRARR